MRQIKFRAWDGKYLHYKRHQSLSVALLDDFKLFGYETVGNLDLIWMQYTGLKDTNGKEIYEGDILLLGLDRFVEVKWFDERASFNPALTWEVYKVVGNIYENPELLSNQIATRDKS